MPGPTRTTATSSAVHASAPGERSSVAYDHHEFATCWGFMPDATRTIRCSNAANVNRKPASSVASFPAALIFATAWQMFATDCAWSRPSAHMSRACSISPQICRPLRCCAERTRSRRAYRAC